MAQPPNAEDATDAVAHLRAQVESLMNDRVTPALANAAGRAESTLCAVRGQAETVSGFIKEQPLVAVVIAGAVGFLTSRVLR